jgi:hypothetical protein
MGKFGKHKWWLVTLLLSVPLVALAAVPNIFTPGTVISSAQVNANFMALDQRITALENATPPQASVVMSNKPGPLGTTGITGGFQSNGGSLLIIVSATSFSIQGGFLDIAVQLDGKTIGDLITYTNEGQSHRALATRAFWLPVGVTDGGAPPAGAHTLGFLNGNTTTTNDGNDYFSATVVEMNH